MSLPCPTFQLVRRADGLYAVRSKGWLFWSYWSVLIEWDLRCNRAVSSWSIRHAEWLPLDEAYQLMAEAKAELGCQTPLGCTAETVDFTAV